jgi:hypothetical protein
MKLFLNAPLPLATPFHDITRDEIAAYPALVPKWVMVSHKL